MRVVLLVVALVLCACATKKAAERPPPSAVPAQAYVPPPPPPPQLPNTVANPKAVTACASFEQVPVPKEEETFFAAYLATELLRSGGGAWVDRTDARDALAEGPKTELTRYVQRVGMQVALKSQRAGASWMFAVVDQSTPMASSSMGGHVFVTTGLLKTLSDEAELATALAHEIAHTVNGDAEKVYALARHRVCLDVLTDIYTTEADTSNVMGAATSGKLLDASQTLQRLGAGKIDCHHADVDGRFVQFMMRRIIRELPNLYTLEQEIAADRLASELLAAAGYAVKLPEVVPKLVRPVLAARADGADEAVALHPGGHAPPLKLKVQ